MNQSSLIIGCVFIAFVVYVTLKGKLPAYLAALIGTNQAPTSSNSNSTASNPAATALGVLSAPDPVGAAATALGAPNVLPSINAAAANAARTSEGLAGVAAFGMP